mmetsp:Transcript_43032/g.80652  ORF Transcript_43032/g.80652 Transcript_43032/m.80652 type:complete len:309 (-) Transcript_43032:280-1206(-)
MYAVFARECARPPPSFDTIKARWTDPAAHFNPGLGYERASYHLHEIRKLKYGTASLEARQAGPLSTNETDFKEFYCGAIISPRSTGAFRGGGAVAYSRADPSVTMAYAVQKYEPVCDLPVVVVCSGNITNAVDLRSLYGLPEAPKKSPAENLLDLYCRDFSDAYGDTSDQPNTCLSVLEGDWCFVLFDAASQYLLVGQSVSPAHALHWGTAKEDGALLFSTEPSLLPTMCSSANGGPIVFPRGCYFENDGFLNPTYECGTIFSLNRPKVCRPVNAMPRVNSRNMVCGISFRSMSNTDLCTMEKGPLVS